MSFGISHWLRSLQGGSATSPGSPTEPTNPTAPGSYTLSIPSATVTKGSSVTVTITITRSNFPDPISLTGSFPAGITGTFSPNPVSGDSATLTLNVDTAVAPGSYTGTVNTTSFAITVNDVLASGDVPAMMSDPYYSTGLRAFPGNEAGQFAAEGFGAMATGGRSATAVILKVTHTGDPTGTTDPLWAGSLRAALTDTRTRHIVFTTGGHCRLRSTINTNNPNFSVYGQTAPGEGFTIGTVTTGFTGNAMLKFNVTNGIVRFLRLRGDGKQADGSYGKYDCITLIGFRNGILDHISAAGGTDEQLSGWGGNRQVTEQWCYLGPAITALAHAKGGLFGNELSRDWTGHHLFYAYAYDRSPFIKAGGIAEIGAIVVYAYDDMIEVANEEATQINVTASNPTPQAPDVNVRGCLTWHNAYSDSQGNSKSVKYYNISNYANNGAATDYCTMYVERLMDNRNRPSLASGDDWTNGVQVSKSADAPLGKLTTPLKTPRFAQTLDPVKDARHTIEYGGAYLPFRDPTDDRIAAHFLNDLNNNTRTGDSVLPSTLHTFGTGIHIAAAGTFPADSDGDGIPDEFWVFLGFTATVHPSGLAFIDSGRLKGYQYVEAYSFWKANELAPGEIQPSGGWYVAEQTS